MAHKSAVGRAHSKPADPNPWHRSRNTVRTKPRKEHGSGPVVKGGAFGRHEGQDPDRKRYT